MKYFMFIMALVFSAPSYAQTTTEYILYYFHTSQRCASCRMIEQNTQEVYENHFPDTITLEFVNIQESENKHFASDYKLYTKFVVISKRVNGQEVDYKNLDQVWHVLNDDAAFETYLVDEISKFMKES